MRHTNLLKFVFGEEKCSVSVMQSPSLQFDRFWQFYFVFAEHSVRRLSSCHPAANLQVFHIRTQLDLFRLFIYFFNLSTRLALRSV